MPKAGHGKMYVIHKMQGSPRERERTGQNESSPLSVKWTTSDLDELPGETTRARRISTTDEHQWRRIQRHEHFVCHVRRLAEHHFTNIFSFCHRAQSEYNRGQ